MKFGRFPFVGLVVALGVMGGPTADAAITVMVNGGLGEPSLFLPNGTSPVPDNNVVRVGHLNAAFDFMSNGDDPSAIGASWLNFGRLTISTILGEPGHVAGPVSKMDTAFDNKQAYLWVLKTTGNTAPAFDYSNVESHMLLTSTASNWTFPEEGAAQPSTLLSLSEANVLHHGNFVSGGTGAFQLVVSVPEPSVFVLVAYGVGLLGWRRQRSDRPFA